MHEHYTHIFARLNNLREHGWGWSAVCPAHEDHNASLTARIATDDGRLFLKCHAGCSFADICEAIGIDQQDCFMPTEQAPAKSKLVKTYDYRDEHGHLLFQVCRFDPKGFSQRRPCVDQNANGKISPGWIYNLDGVRRVLYRLPDLVSRPHDIVFIVEGEKDADRLHGGGLLATTSSGGAGKWHLTDSEQLSGRNVVIIGDNDEPGIEHAKFITDDLIKRAFTVRLCNLLPAKDLSAWLDSGCTIQTLREIVSRLPPVGGTAEPLRNRIYASCGNTHHYVITPETTVKELIAWRQSKDNIIISGG